MFSASESCRIATILSSRRARVLLASTIFFARRARSVARIAIDYDVGVRSGPP